MSLEDLRHDWDVLGRADPFWAILTWPGRRHNRWDPEEFFRTGEEEVAGIMGHVERLGLEVRRGRALDFGCGVGRATQALARRFDRVHGVDIAPSMIRLAHRFNRDPGRCSYHLNASDDLRLFPDDSFELVYSAHVLQHMEAVYSRRYVEELIRVLAPGGLAIFQTCSEPIVGPGEALPDDAFRASLSMTGSRLRMRPSERASVRVVVANRSGHVWPAAGRDGWFQVMLGNHWLDRAGRSIVNDDGRCALPHDVEPGESVELEADVRAPADPGPYLLQMDLVQEGVAWFAERGSGTATIPVRVRRPVLPRDRRAATRGGEEQPTIPMYGVAEEDVRGWITGAGGSVIDVVDWRLVLGPHAPDWVRLFFTATKQPARGLAGS